MKVEKVNVNLIQCDNWGTPPSPGLIKSIEDQGVLLPVVVREVKEDKSYMLIDGRRRLQACLEIGITQVDAIVYPVDVDLDFISQLTIVLNGIRSDNPISEYVSIKQLLDFGYMINDIVKQTGVPKSTVKKRLLLDKLPEDILQMVVDGGVALGTAELLAKQPQNVRDQLIGLTRQDKKLTQRQIREAKTAHIQKNVDRLPSRIFDQSLYDVYPPGDGFIALLDTLDQTGLTRLHATMIGKQQFDKMRKAIEERMM